jgi:hypothetical protein
MLLDTAWVSQHIEITQFISSQPLTNEQTEALLRELSQIIENDRYPLSPRIRTLKEIREKLRPDPVREPLPPALHYEPPSKGRYDRRR